MSPWRSTRARRGRRATTNQNEALIQGRVELVMSIVDSDWPGRSCHLVYALLLVYCVSQLYAELISNGVLFALLLYLSRPTF